MVVERAPVRANTKDWKIDSAPKREGLGEKLNVDVTGDDWQFTLIAFIAFAQYLESFVNIWPRHSSALEYWKCNSFKQVHNSPSSLI